MIVIVTGITRQAVGAETGIIPKLLTIGFKFGLGLFRVSGHSGRAKYVVGCYFGCTWSTRVIRRTRITRVARIFSSAWIARVARVTRIAGFSRARVTRITGVAWIAGFGRARVARITGVAWISYYTWIARVDSFSRTGVTRIARVTRIGRLSDNNCS